jgi:hypothetical protein
VTDMASSWVYLPPLILVGLAFLVFMDLVGRENRRDQPVTGDQPTEAVRRAVIVLLLVASVAHIPLIGEHLEEAPYMGVLFIGFTVSAFGVAAVLAARPSQAWFYVAGALCAAAVGAYVATRIVAFPELGDDVGAWTEPLGLVSISAEAGVVVFSLLAVRGRPAFAGSAQSTRVAPD